jgi:hypothetical protein
LQEVAEVPQVLQIHLNMVEVHQEVLVQEVIMEHKLPQVQMVLLDKVQIKLLLIIIIYQAVAEAAGMVVVKVILVTVHLVIVLIMVVVLVGYILQVHLVHGNQVIQLMQPIGL